MHDPSKPLPDAQHERFACELAKGASQDEAYELAGFSRNRGNACRLKAKESVSQRVKWLQEQAASADVLTIAEKRRICAEIARGGEHRDRLNAIRVDNDLAADGAEANRPAQVIIVRIGGADDGDD